MLAYDICRCKTALCPKRFTCQRNLYLEVLGPRTPVAYAICLETGGNYINSEFKFYIPEETNVCKSIRSKEII